ncbi:endonuclease domain-containing protein [Schumannella sp. 10F1B-5-1]|uniref:endonuclease domain-containing protein n=1 Tax=Schumannella sp. 10F1B-5-1 TaxID=2590780 RepID=UPI0015E8498F|nr:DUF559 domain-containing protein [Schumannella sp. 10F1B-5-1]
MVESALEKKVLRQRELDQLTRHLPDHLRALLSRATPLAGSGTETLFVRRASRLGIRIRQQVWVGPDRVDAVLGDRLVVEIDSREFHERERDADRDARLIAAGYRILRFTYRQVMHDWASVEAALRSALGRGDHRI